MNLHIIVRPGCEVPFSWGGAGEREGKRGGNGGVSLLVSLHSPAASGQRWGVSGQAACCGWVPSAGSICCPKPPAGGRESQESWACRVKIPEAND